LLNFYFYNILLLLPFFLYFISFWTFFIKNNFFSIRINPSSTDILKNSKILKKIHYIFFLNWSLVNFFYFFIFLFFLKLDFFIFWFNHLKINNFIYNIIIILFVISYLVLYFMKFFRNSNLNFNIDYFFSIINLILFILLLFLSNTFYTFIFILEIISLCFLYKFTVSKYWFKKNYFFDKNSSLLNRFLPKTFINMLFFQYWVNFFSSVIILFVLFNLIYMFGSSDWIFLNLLNFINFNIFYFNNFYFFIFLWVLFFIGLFFKLSFPPMHFFKIEIYKGLTLVSMFFYTTFYFLSFFIFFILFTFYFLVSFKIYFFYIFFIFFILSIIFLSFLIFDNNFFKNFFAYSSLANILSFFCIVLVSL